MRLTFPLFVALALAGVWSCSSSDTAPSGPEGQSGQAGQAGQGGQGGTIADGGPEAEAGSGDDGNDDCAHAVALALGGKQSGVIQSPGDADYFLVEAKADTFVKLRTTGNPTSLPAKVNTVLTILDGDGQTLGYNDDRSGSDSQLVYRMPADGKLCVKVEDHSSWKNETPLRGDSSFSYVAYATALTESAGSVRDKEPNDDVAGAQSAGLFKPNLSFLFGTLTPDADVDVYKLGVASTAQFHCEGTTVGAFDGTTLPDVRISLLDATGSTIMARLDPFKPDKYICAWFEAGASELLMKIERPTGSTVGANPYYVREWNAGALTDYGNHYEIEPAAGANDVAANAEEPALVNSGTKKVDYPVFGRIQQAGDVDYYLVTAQAGQILEFEGRAASMGSGLIDAQFSLRDAADQEIRSEVEPDGGLVVWSDTRANATNKSILIAADGDYYVRVSAAGQSTEVAGQLYTFDVVIVSP
jgi:hypothetical protein